MICGRESVDRLYRDKHMSDIYTLPITRKEERGRAKGRNYTLEKY